MTRKPLDPDRRVLSFREREAIRESTIRHLAKALAGMYDDRGDLSLSLLEAGRALYGIAELDTDASARDKVLAFLAEPTP